MTECYDLLVIGAGAAGVMAAITAKQHAPQARVCLLEGAIRPLMKVKVSGGGRCNVTNTCPEPKELVTYYPRSHKGLVANFSRFGTVEIQQWFESRGVRLKPEPDGRVFPVSDESQTIVDCLLAETRRLSITLYTQAFVSELTPLASGGWQILLKSGKRLTAQVVVMATGGSKQGYNLLKALELPIIEPVPSLFTFCVADKALHELAGVSVSAAKATLQVENEKITQQGPLLVTHWGLSGPLILRLSAFGARLLEKSNYQGQLWVDFCPEVKQDELQAVLLGLKLSAANKKLANELPVPLTGLVSKRLWLYLLQSHGLSVDLTWQEAQNKALNALGDKLKRWPFAITGKGPFKEEFVTAGGLDLAALDLKTYATKAFASLYVVGETTNVDGLTGGFNLQHAWTSGYLAGCSVAEQLNEGP